MRVSQRFIAAMTNFPADDFRPTPSTDHRKNQVVYAWLETSVRGHDLDMTLKT